jgi:hypothetical protein
MIRRHGDFPPNGFMFTDARSGLSFGEQGEFGSVVLAIIKHRQANPKIYPKNNLATFDYESVARELEQFTCARLNNNPRYCESGEPKPVSTDGLVLMAMPRRCPRCGCGNGYQILCKTCAGKRVTGYYCSECKNLCAR